MKTYPPITLLFIIIATIFFLIGCSSSNPPYVPTHPPIVIFQPASKTPLLIEDNKIHLLSPRQEVRYGWWHNGLQPKGYSYGQRTVWLHQWNSNEHHRMDWHKFWSERGW